MKRVLRAALVVSCVSSMAFAQVAEVEEVDVGVQGAAVQVNGLGAAVQVGPVGAAVVMPGVSANVRVGAVQTSAVVVEQPVVVRERVVVQQAPVIVREKVVVQQQPVYVQQQYARDCGTGPNDPGCLMHKNGQLPLDGPTFAGILQTLRAQRNTITREEMAQKMFARSFVTAAQLGLVLDAFADHGITQLDVAKDLAPRVVNPQHALVHSTKFQNSISAEEYVGVMAAQAPGY
jgi:hypothetical protein